MTPIILTAPPVRRSATYCTADAQMRMEQKIPGRAESHPDLTFTLPQSQGERAVP
jgi:hypothetical protein